jgi:tRNA modification GTPase
VKKAGELNDTIVAIATPLGEGGLGVIRLSGPQAFSVATYVFRSASPLIQASTHTLHHGSIVDQDHPIDDAMAAVFRSPRSYTGEDVVELSCHGSPVLIRKVLSLCLSAGARLAEGGEFTRRAFLSGKMDLAQAEAVVDLIAARSNSFRHLALEQLQGRLSERLQHFRQDLVDLLARLEANVDFVDDEIPGLSLPELRCRLDVLGVGVQELLQTVPQGRLLRNGLRAVLVGQPNVGKSSLFNRLLGMDRAIVTEEPGTTRDTLEETVLVENIPVTWTDTAGLREGAGRVEMEGIARTRRALEKSDVAVLVVDVRAPPSAQDEEIARCVKGQRVVVALNKSDGLPEGKIPEAWCSFLDGVGSGVLTSALDGRGVEDLHRVLLPKNQFSLESSPTPILINLRHETLLQGAAEALSLGKKGAESGAGPECVALDLRQALDSIGQITGESTSEEVLDAIFAKFCVGK